MSLSTCFIRKYMINRTLIQFIRWDINPLIDSILIKCITSKGVSYLLILVFLYQQKLFQFRVMIEQLKLVIEICTMSRLCTYIVPNSSYLKFRRNNKEL